jgi:hypothetical protein
VLKSNKSINRNTHARFFLSISNIPYSLQNWGIFQNRCWAVFDKSAHIGIFKDFHNKLSAQVTLPNLSELFEMNGVKLF